MKVVCTVEATGERTVVDASSTVGAVVKVFGYGVKVVPMEDPYRRDVGLTVEDGVTGEHIGTCVPDGKD